MKTNGSSWQPDFSEVQRSWPCIEQVEIIDDGLAIGVLLREFDGTISAIRISVDQLAD